CRTVQPGGALMRKPHASLTSAWDAPGAPLALAGADDCVGGMWFVSPPEHASSAAHAAIKHDRRTSACIRRPPAIDVDAVCCLTAPRRRKPARQCRRLAC